MSVTDRQTDTQGKNNMSPNPKGGRHNEIKLWFVRNPGNGYLYM